MSIKNKTRIVFLASLLVATALPVACDDGNLDDGDGCTSECESTWPTPAEANISAAEKLGSTVPLASSWVDNARDASFAISKRGRVGGPACVFAHGLWWWR
jgi:hypothetical protein